MNEIYIYNEEIQTSSMTLYLRLVFIYVHGYH